MARLSSSNRSMSSTLTLVLAIFALFLTTAHAQGPPNDGKTYIQGTDKFGVTRNLANDRYPALYTGEFGDCLGGQSLINVTSFDAAYYADNMTVLFHIEGTTNIQNDTIMLIISVDAYGEGRFDMAFDPCNANIKSLCPMNASIPISGEAIIPVSINDVGGIPDIALSIPDFEGSATLHFLSNSSRTEIGCFQAVMKNGASLSHPEAVGSVLGVFTLIAVLASFATAIYGVSVPAMRTHYAHSLSVLVIFEAFQSFFFSGALSLAWPSVCAAWWSNFAWSAGIIHTSAMMDSINNFVGNPGNSSQVGGAGSVQLNNKGGLMAIYGRSTQLLPRRAFNAVMSGARLASRIQVRQAEEPADGGATGGEAPSGALGRGYDWNGPPVAQGMPIPGDWSNFTGSLSTVNVPATDAFLTSLIWFLVLLAAVIVATVGFKGIIEGFAKMKWVKKDRLAYFRSHWLGYLAQIVLRTLLIGFFAMMVLPLYQFSIHGNLGVNGGVIAVAAIVFVIFFVGLLGAAAYACFYRVKVGKYESVPDRVMLTHQKFWKCIPYIGFSRQSTLEYKLREKDLGRLRHAGSFPLFRIMYTYNDPTMTNIHEDESYTKRFGWLSARYRRTKWYFFCVWLVYQFIRACFIGGASKNPEAQVYGIFVVEIIFAIIIVKINPFESSRNTALAVYLLSISKVVTAGLSIAFLPKWKIARIPTTVVGFVIVITQGFVTVAILILIALGAISSYMSIMRNRDQFHPTAWQGLRLKYYAHLEEKAVDVPPQRPETPKVEEPVEPYFAVKNVYRAPKIEDEDEDHFDVEKQKDWKSSPDGSDAPPKTDGNGNSNGYFGHAHHNSVSCRHSRHSRHGSVGSLPFGARPHRASWSSKDFANMNGDGAGAGPGAARPQLPVEWNMPSGHVVRSRANSGAQRMGGAATPVDSVRNDSAAGVRSDSPAGVGLRDFSSSRSASRVASNSRPNTPSEEVRLKHAGERFGAAQ